MLFLKRSLVLHVYLVAGFFAAVIPMCTGYLAYYINLGACYDYSPCLWPLLLMIVPLFVAPTLTILFAINRRFQGRIPDGLAPTVLMCACVGQVETSVLGFLRASPNYRQIFFSDILFFPQGFVVSLLVGFVFWTALYLLGREITEP